MLLNALQLINFRNYASGTAVFSPRLNLIYGENAQGKSNLLEAICYLALNSSFREASDGEILGWGQDFFRLEAQAESGRAQLELAIGYDRSKRKSWQINGLPQTKLHQVLGYLHVVIFSPADLALVQAGPQVRRRFLNREMVQLKPDFCSLLVRYNQVIRQRNAVLKTGQAGPLLAAWNQQLVTLGAQIIHRRLALLQRLKPLAASFHRALSREREGLTIKYRGIAPEEQLLAAGFEQLQELFWQRLTRMEEAEKSRGMSLLGPHRDDFELEINGKITRQYGSQGQQRTAALALKLAELELAREERGECPLLLLDDVLSELDAGRRQQLLQMMNGLTQTFITTTDQQFQLEGAKSFYISAGNIKEEKEKS